MINIKGLDKVKILQVLYENSVPLGLGFLQEAKSGGILTEEVAKGHLEYDYVDYCQGRVIKCNLKKDEFDPRLYDRDNGEGAAERALKEANLI